MANIVPAKMGAYERLVQEVGRNFRKNGEQLIVAVAGQPIERVASAWKETGLVLETVRGWDNPANGGALRLFANAANSLIRQHEPDAVALHFGNELPALIAMMLARIAGYGRLKWIWEQDQQIADPGVPTAHISRLRLLSLFSWHFVAVYDGGRASMLKRGIPADRITVIPNAVADHVTERPRGWLRHELGLPETTALCACVASLIPRKRIDFLLDVLERIMRQLRPANPQAVALLIVGEGPELPALMKRAENLGVAGNVHFLGMRQDVRDLLCETDVYVHSSLAETCTYAVTEAMSAGIPAVVTEAGAAREQIDDGKSGYVVGRDDVEGFAGRLAGLIADPERRKAMGAVARTRWEQFYRVEESARRYYELYRKVARG